MDVQVVGSDSVLAEETKKCRHCAEVKPIEEFPYTKTDPTVRGTWCQQCKTELSEFRKKNPIPRPTPAQMRAGHEKRRKKAEAGGDGRVRQSAPEPVEPPAPVATPAPPVEAEDDPTISQVWGLLDPTEQVRALTYITRMVAQRDR